MKNKIFSVILTVVVCMSSIFDLNVYAAAKSYLYISKKPVSTKTIYVGEEGVKLKYNINGVKKGIKGTWKSDNPKKVKVSKNGICTAKANGKATISFNCIYKRKKYSLKCRMTVETEAGEISLVNEKKNTNEVSLEIGSTHKFSSKILPTDEALEVNSKIKSTYKVFYQLFADEDCTKKTKLGEINEKGEFTAGDKAGVLYVRSSAKKKKKAADDVVSDVIKINITEPKQEEKVKEDSKKEETKKEENNKPAQTTDKSNPTKIEISSNATMTDTTQKNGVYFATAYFKIFDGNGKEITAREDIANDRFNVEWNGNKIPVSESGKVSLLFPASLPNTPSPIGTSGAIKISYKNKDGSEIKDEKNVVIAPPAIITTAELKGIYKCNFSTTNGSIYYETVMDKDTVRLKNGDEIKDFGSSAWVNMNKDSYYLLIKATDSYGNNINSMGLRDYKLNVDVTGSAIVSVDTVLENGVETKESIRPITIDGVSYLTYPLRETKVKSGEMIITIQGGAVRQVIKKTITDGSSLMTFFVTAGTTYIGEDNILQYSLYTSSGTAIKEYNSVIHYLGLKDEFSAGRIMLPYDSEIISSSKGSTFSIIRNETTREAELHYMPNVNVLINNEGRMQEFGLDEITVMKNRGKNLEQKSSIGVSQKRR